MQQIQSVEFHGTQLSVINHNGQPYVAMKSIVEGMGLDWAGQFTKFKSNPRFCIEEISMQMPGDDQQRAVSCMPLRKLPGWLMSIHPNKVKPEIREKVITYQNECDDALWDYWNKGIAVNPNYRPEETRVTNQGGLTLAQIDVIKATHKALLNGFPEDKQGGVAVKLWSSIKAKFGVSYKDVPPEAYQDVLSLMARVAADMKPADVPVPATRFMGGDQMAAIQNMVSTRIREMPNRSEQSAAVHRLYGALKAKYGVTYYRLIPAKHFHDVIEFLADFPLEGGRIVPAPVVVQCPTPAPQAEGLKEFMRDMAQASEALARLTTRLAGMYQH